MPEAHWTNGKRCLSQLTSPDHTAVEGMYVQSYYVAMAGNFAHCHRLVATLDAELPVRTWLSTNTGALVPTGKRLGAAQITRKPAAGRSTWQMTLTLQEC